MKQWIYLFRSQFPKYLRFRFGFFESVRWAIWQADRISASGRGFRKWMEEQGREFIPDGCEPWMPDEDEEEDEDYHSEMCVCEHCIQNYPERSYLIDDIDDEPTS